MNKLSHFIYLTWKMIRYNLKIIFGNRFIYFLVSAIVMFLFIVGLNLFNGEVISEAGIYRILTLTGALLLFYPVAFGIQSDKDCTLEIIFGIPDYRYRVWLMRLILIYAITFIILMLLSILLHFSLIQFAIFSINLQVMMPLAFLGLLTFFLSTLLKNGNGTAATVIILGVILAIVGVEKQDFSDVRGYCFFTWWFNEPSKPGEVFSIINNFGIKLFFFWMIYYVLASDT